MPINDNLTDWYSLVENGLSSRLRVELLFMGYITDGKQVSDNDSVLYTGIEYAVIFRPGSFPFLPMDYETGKITDVDWKTNIHLYLKYKEKAEQWSLFRPFRNAIIQLIQKHRFLKKVFIGESYPQEFAEVPNIDRIRGISGESDAGYFRFFNTPETKAPNFMTQQLVITTRQRVRFL